MLRTSLTTSLTNSKLLSNTVNKDRVNGKQNDVRKNLLIFSMLQKLTRADYLTSCTKKAFNLF